MNKKWVKKLDVLYYRKGLMIEYLKDRVAEEDWHGCQDAASDIREIVTEIKLIEELLNEGVS